MEVGRGAARVATETRAIPTRKKTEGRGNPAASKRAIRPLRRLPLGSLRVFVAVAQHLSFTRAADALGVSASAASLQIRALEEYLSRRLFRRNGRQVLLTNEGSALLPRVQHALQELERAVDDVRLERMAGPRPSHAYGCALDRAGLSAYYRSLRSLAKLMAAQPH